MQKKRFSEGTFSNNNNNNTNSQCYAFVFTHTFYITLRRCLRFRNMRNILVKNNTALGEFNKNDFVLAFKTKSFIIFKKKQIK